MQHLGQFRQLFALEKALGFHARSIFRARGRHHMSTTRCDAFMLCTPGRFVHHHHVPLPGFMIDAGRKMRSVLEGYVQRRGVHGHAHGEGVGHASDEDGRHGFNDDDSDGQVDSGGDGDGNGDTAGRQERDCPHTEVVQLWPHVVKPIHTAIEPCGICILWYCR
jgi:hypothetical protein